MSIPRFLASTGRRQGFVGFVSFVSSALTTADKIPQRECWPELIDSIEPFVSRMLPSEVLSVLSVLSVESLCGAWPAWPSPL
jgi:hypothetical protein